jgi:hypothetical protein
MRYPKYKWETWIEYIHRRTGIYICQKNNTDYSIKRGDIVRTKNGFYEKCKVIDVNYAMNSVAVQLFADNPRTGIVVWPIYSIEKTNNQVNKYEHWSNRT